MTNAQSPAGPNFQSERELALAGPPVGGGGGRTRRPSVLDSHVAPSELLAGGGGGDHHVNGASRTGTTSGGTAIGVVGGPPGARGRARTNSSLLPPTSNGGAGVNGSTLGDNTANGGYGQMPAPDPAELQNARAVEVLDRVQQKLTGRDFKNEEELEVDMQVNKLIGEATRLENLCQHYIGWCSFW